MKEHPILFSGEMVRAILKGWKTQTRRVVNLPWDDEGEEGSIAIEWGDSGHSGPGFYLYCPEYPEEGGFLMNCPYGKPGDLLWVRETWAVGKSMDDAKPSALWGGDEHSILTVDYAANEKRVWGAENQGKWRPSIHMPRWASRIELEITNIRVERLQDISEDDAKAEGIGRTDWKYSCEPYRDYREPKMAPGRNCSTAIMSFLTLWNSINSKRGFGWDANPWVWVISFMKRIRG